MKLAVAFGVQPALYAPPASPGDPVTDTSYLVHGVFRECTSEVPAVQEALF
jgi:hypothetical protein